ncbi:hypothetical protein BDV12DRAFT_192649 [Aspergillus spectabilis]
MADSTVERLNRLQMNDLGTARREHISTTDSRIRNTRIEVIEATRRSNVPGSTEQRLAEANKSRLEGWANIHRKIGDTGDLERLDNILDGQTHRLLLNARMHQGGSEINGYRDRKIGNFTGHTQPIPVLDGPSTRSVSAAGGRAPNAPNLRSRRPIANHSPQIISTPEAFMAVHRGNNPTNQPAGKLPAEKQKSPNHTTAKPAPPPNTSQKPSQQAISQSSPVPTPNGKTSVEAKPPAISTDTTNQVKEEKTTDIKPQDFAAIEIDIVPTLPPQKTQELLLDLSTTPRESEADNGMSLALEELQGLEFKQLTEPQHSHLPGLECLESANGELDSEGVHDEKPGEQSVTEATTGPIDEELAEEYMREIDIICELLERTSISDTFLSSLTECKAALESELRLRRRPGPDRERSQQQSIPQAPELMDPEFGASTSTAVTPSHSRTLSDSQTSTPSSQTRLNATAPQFMPKSFTQYRSLSDATSTDSSTSFQPALSEAVTQDRSTDDSSDSTTIQAPLDTQSPQNQTETLSPEPTSTEQHIASVAHIFGNHLLPGGSSRIPEVAPQVHLQPVQSHIFGDHLLPGRSAITFEMARPAVRSVNTPALFAAPKSIPVTITAPPPPQPLKPVSPNTSKKNGANSSSLKGSSLAPNARFEPAKKSLTLKPTNTTTPTAPATATRKTTPAIMESIYAWKPQSNGTDSAGQKKSSSEQGLMASRYSDPKWV